MDFGKKLKKERENFNLSQLEFAKKIGVSRSAVGNYETDRNMPSAETLDKITSVLNCSLDYLLGKTDVRNVKEINFANNNGIDINGLDDEDIKELQKQVDYIKKLKGNK